MTRLGILGGTFDPVHLGHQDVALAARAALELDRVLLVPARIPPHRSRSPVGSGADRLAMVELAASVDDGLEACDLELTSEGPSYTARTLAILTRGRDRSQYFFITGADAFADIASWHDYPDVLDLCHFVVVSRPGHPTTQLRERHPGLASRMRAWVGHTHHARAAETTGPPAIWLVDAVTRDISSSDIRARRSAGRPIDTLVSPGVGAYILEHQLYTDHPSDTVLQPENDT